MKKFLSLLLVSILGGAITLGIYKFAFEKQIPLIENQENQSKFVTASYNPSTLEAAENINFTEAADKTVHAVVHVKNLTVSKGPTSIMEYFYGSGSSQPRTQVGTGSGVIISPDGYIVTNNHVIANATRLQVTLNNNKTYSAELIGTDPETDIALIKIDAESDLPYLAFGDSDYSKIGEWVLAVGNPFNLTSTVTAGIISAKARDLNEQDGVFQSFIQTDAAVNPGNSGGALVNTNGELIGINTAITSQTGSYIGYSFAVPSNIAKKVVDDIMEFGNVQMGTLGIKGQDLAVLNGRVEGINESEGVLVAEVFKKSGAYKAGLKSGDIIKKIDNIKISKFSDLTGYLRSKRPNDLVNLTILRDDENMELPVTLIDNTSYTYTIEEVGISIQAQTKSDKDRYNNQEGVVIYSTNDYNRRLGLDGKLLVGINDDKIETIDDAKKAVAKAKEYGMMSLVILNEHGERERLVFRN
ncbi:S1C family serine protease [Galbibacter orientalis]|uniref:Trypsin-like serine protease with C-terminal PDZ domain n=1 Tax=Galbibacter orientalis DSM 19592 TaxID=926559 RepID=I3C924_9FLAO|nr:trypsin-like peptidase domain-containing protein [Galbibacter orientalis]EIJ40117.1 trypsin-like serine protease with C-terminal PDZ domain [Galbibacter orientalis DSM 19592]